MPAGNYPETVPGFAAVCLLCQPETPFKLHPGFLPRVRCPTVLCFRGPPEAVLKLYPGLLPFATDARKQVSLETVLGCALLRFASSVRRKLS